MKAIFKDLFSNWRTVPNLLSFLRILMVPAFAVLFNKGEYLWAVAVLALSGLSDFFDGKIARRFNQISSLGKILDPIADKLTQITIAVMFYLTFAKAQDELIRKFSFVFLVFLIKEAVMVIGGAALIAMGIKPGAAEMPGKVATFAFYLIMISIIGFGPEIGIISNAFNCGTYPPVVMVVLICISAVLCLVAFCSYLPATFKQVKEKNANK